MCYHPITLKNANKNSYDERWRDWPFEASATILTKRKGANSSKVIIALIDKRGILKTTSLSKKLERLVVLRKISFVFFF